MIRIQWILILLILLSPQLTRSDTCTQDFLLSNIFQDTIIIQPTATNGVINYSQMYNYSTYYFDTLPGIIYTIENFQVSSFSELNYFIIANVGSASVNFTLTSQSMNWTLLNLKFWLIARADIIVGTFTLENINPLTSQINNITVQSNIQQFINSNNIQLNFVTGLHASSPNDLIELDVSNNGVVSNGTLSVKVSALGQTTIQKIQVSYIIFNTALSYFASGGAQLNFYNAHGPQYEKVHGSFAPIYYLLSGFDSLNISKNNGFQLQYTLDDDYVLQANAGNFFNYYGAVYLTIGQQPINVCSCGNFIEYDGCVDSCSPLTYPFTNYVNGGKSCLTCSAKLYQTINQFNTECVCLPGYIRVDDICIPGGQSISCTDPNSVLSNGECVCSAGTQNVSGVCKAMCQQNEEYNNIISQCQCAYGYSNISGICGVCPSGRLYDPNLSICNCLQNQFLSGTSCQCYPGFYSFTNGCVRSCPTGYTASNQQCVLNLTCLSTQIVQNGVCVCPNPKYVVNGQCSTCPGTTYYNSTSQSCINCQANCLSCVEFVTCATCKSQYLWNSTSKMCQLNSICGFNQIFINGQCTCVDGTNKINGICGSCSPGSYYDTVTGMCKLSNCSNNQIFVNGLCNCMIGYHLINGVCTACQSRQYYNSATNSCGNCPQNCINCTNQATCSLCENYYRMVNGFCAYNLYNLKNGFPKFTPDYVVTVFTSSQPTTRHLTSEELYQIVNIQIKPDNGNSHPSQVVMIQNPQNLSQIRVIFSYCKGTPMETYNATYGFTDSTINPDKTDYQGPITYNVIDSGFSQISFI